MPEAAPRPVSIETAEHYPWGDGCDGWLLLPRQDLLILGERMPPGAAEVRHVHAIARQFFYVLSGELTMDCDGEPTVIAAGQGLEIPPGQRHQACNRSDADVRFLVISMPSTRGDRTDG